MSKLISIFSSPFRMRIYFLKKLPSLFFWKIKVEQINKISSKVSIPFCWRTQNPFRSIYFSALAGTAELSTGLLAFLAIENKNMSMLVVGVKGEFFKKANTKTYFVCEQGNDIIAAVEKAIQTGEGQTVTVVSKGYNNKDEIVAQFEFVWSFKKRK